jgi:hypothetical protein
MMDNQWPDGWLPRCQGQSCGAADDFHVQMSELRQRARTIFPNSLAYRCLHTPPTSNGRNRSRAPTHHSLQQDLVPKHYSRIHTTKRHEFILSHGANFSRTRLWIYRTTKGRRRQVAQEAQRCNTTRSKDGYPRSKA